MGLRHSECIYINISVSIFLKKFHFCAVELLKKKQIPHTSDKKVCADFCAPMCSKYS